MDDYVIEAPLEQAKFRLLEQVDVMALVAVALIIVVIIAVVDLARTLSE